MASLIRTSSEDWTKRTWDLPTTFRGLVMTLGVDLYNMPPGKPLEAWKVLKKFQHLPSYRACPDALKLEIEEYLGQRPPLEKFNPHHDQQGQFASADEEALTRRPNDAYEGEVWDRETDAHPSPLMKHLTKRDGVHTITDLRPGDVLKETWRNSRTGNGPDADRPGDILRIQYLTVESVNVYNSHNNSHNLTTPWVRVIARRPSGQMSFWSGPLNSRDEPVIQEGDPSPPQEREERVLGGETYTVHYADIFREYLGSMPEPKVPYTEEQYRQAYDNFGNDEAWDGSGPPRLFLGGDRFFESDKEAVTRTDPVYGHMRILPSIRLVGFDGILPPEPASQAQREDFGWEYRKDMAMWSHYPEAARQIAQGVDAMEQKGISSSALDKIQVYTDPPVIDAENEAHGEAYAYCVDQIVTIKSQYLTALAEDYRRTHGMPLDGYADSHGLALVGKMITSDINSGFHPDKDGHSAVESIMVHEVGHALLNQITDQGKDRVGEFMNRVLGPEGLGLKWRESQVRQNRMPRELIGTPLTWPALAGAFDDDDPKGAMHAPWYFDAKRVSRMVSGYATKNFHEMMAEAFTEGVLSAHPRKVAKLVVKLLGEYTQ